MKTPKYAVGDVFYALYTTGKNAPTKDESNFIAVPAIAVITSVSINRKEVTYTLMEYKKQNKGYIERKKEITESSGDMERYTKSYTEQVDKMTVVFKESFVELTKAVNKEKLDTVLHGE